MNMEYTASNAKCNFCDNPKYVERLNNKGVLENYCLQCIDKLKRREG